MKRLVSMLTAGLAILSMNLSISAEISQEPLKPSDIFDLEFASYPQVSPDGRKILYMRRSFDVMRDATRVSLWLFDLTTTDIDH
jgi:acylaminoacyl-peptidase